MKRWLCRIIGHAYEIGNSYAYACGAYYAQATRCRRCDTLTVTATAACDCPVSHDPV